MGEWRNRREKEGDERVRRVRRGAMRRYAGGGGGDNAARAGGGS